MLVTPNTAASSLGEDVVGEDTEGMEGVGEEREQSKTQLEKERKRRAKAPIVVQHVDIIEDGFWERRPWLFSDRPGKVGTKPV